MAGMHLAVQEEGQLVMGLFKELCAFLRGRPQQGSQPHLTIGIITFYRGQMEHLRSLLRAFDPIAAEHVSRERKGVLACLACGHAKSTH